MPEAWLLQLGVVGTGIGIFVAVNALFFKADDFFSTEFKEDLALRLMCLEPPNSKSSWPEYFIQLFDRVFSKQQKPGGKPLPEWRKHLSWRCFWRSCVTSLIAVGLLSLAGLPGHLDWNTGNAVFVLTMASGAIVYNVIPDYVSLLETRYLLRFVRRKPTALRVIGVLVIDATATIGIFWIFVIFTVVSAYLTIPALADPDEPIFWPEFFADMFGEWKQIIWMEEGGLWMFGIFFYSTFFTSAWLWLFAVSQLLFRTASRMGPVLRLVQYVLPIEERPFRSIGIVAGLIATLAYLALAPFR